MKYLISTVRNEIVNESNSSEYDFEVKEVITPVCILSSKEEAEKVIELLGTAQSTILNIENSEEMRKFKEQLKSDLKKLDHSKSSSKSLNQKFSLPRPIYNRDWLNIAKETRETIPEYLDFLKASSEYEGKLAEFNRQKEIKKNEFSEKRFNLEKENSVKSMNFSQELKVRKLTEVLGKYTALSKFLLDHYFYEKFILTEILDFSL